MRIFPAALLLASLPALAGSRLPSVASYRIEAAWDEGKKLLTGHETITFTNRTSHTFGQVELHLYLNAFRNERSTFFRETGGAGRGKGEERFGMTEVTRIALAGGPDLTSSLVFVSPDDGNPEDRTVAALPLRSPVPPGGTLELAIDFVSRFPRAAMRTGWKDDFLMAAQWFPKLGKATDGGWVTHQYHGSTEFFADFGDYDVTLDVPASLRGKVAATGLLKEETSLPGKRLRLRFVAEDVHDFAWAASPRFEVTRDTFSRPPLPPVDIALFLQSDHRTSRARTLRAAKETLAALATTYLPYPYPLLTLVDPPWGTNAGGMEYPTLVTTGTRWMAPEGTGIPEDVTIHEVLHQLFYGIVANDETAEGHLDEGVTTYLTSRILEKSFGRPLLGTRVLGLPLVLRSPRLALPDGDAERFLDWAGRSGSDAVTRLTYENLDEEAAEANAYTRPALTLASLEGAIGTEKVDRILRGYATRWAFAHPRTEDFLAVVRDEAGGAWAETLRRLWAAPGAVDYSVTLVTSEPGEAPAGFFGEGSVRRFRNGVESRKDAAKWDSTVVVQRLGEGVWPVSVELVFASGKPLRRSWNGEERWIRYRITGPRLVSATVDPGRKLLLDVNPLNDGLATRDEPRLARRLSHHLRFLTQNLLELFAGLAACPPPGL